MVAIVFGPSKTLTVEKPTGSFEVLSIIFPLIIPGLFCWASKFTVENTTTKALKMCFNFMIFFNDLNE